MGNLALCEATEEKERMLFVRCPWDIYSGDRYRVPPLIRETIAKISPNHPFYSHADLSLFIARKNGRVVGRVAAIIDRHYLEFHGRKTGFFGFFESLPGSRYRPGAPGSGAALAEGAGHGRDGRTHEPFDK